MKVFSRKIWMPRWRTSCFALCLLAGGSAAVPAGAAASFAAPVPALSACATSTTVVWLSIPTGSAAAGSFSFDLKFTNLSRRACALSGYPGVSAIDLAGRRLGSPALRTGTPGHTPTDLASGLTATAVLRITDVNNFPATTCKRVTAAGLRVYPPGEKSSRVVPFPFVACANAGDEFLQVATIKA